MRFRDIGCDDFEKAARNREMVAQKRNISWYLMVETFLRGWPLTKPLPSWIPLGRIPMISKHENLWGMHVIDENVDMDNKRNYDKDGGA